MNKEPIVPKRELNDFFFENRIYEFSQKTLSTTDRDEMKSYLSNDSYAKEKTASALMSFEYLQDLSETTVFVEHAEKLLKKKKARAFYIKVIALIFFTCVFFFSGLLAMKIYL